MNDFVSFELQPRRRPGEEYEDGTWKTERNFLDFVVGGRSLYETLVLAKGYDLISAIWLDTPDSSAEAAERLLLLRPADLPDNRRSLFVCPECGDLGCGAISVVIEHDTASVIWRAFGYENNYGEQVITEGFKDVGPFLFEPREYEAALRGAGATPAPTERPWKPHEIERGWRREDLYDRGRPR